MGYHSKTPEEDKFFVTSLEPGDMFVNKSLKDFPRFFLVLKKEADGVWVWDFEAGWERFWLRDHWMHKNIVEVKKPEF